MAISFSEGFKDLQLADLSKVVCFKRYYFVPTFGVQVSHFVHMAIITAARVAHACIAGGGVPCYWACPLALYGAHSMLHGNSSM